MIKEGVTATMSELNVQNN